MRSMEDQAMSISDPSEPIVDSQILPDGEAFQEIEAEGREAASKDFEDILKQMNDSFDRAENEVE